MKFAHTIFTAALIATLAGCGSEGPSSSADNPSSRPQPVETDGIVFGYDPAPLTIEESEQIQFAQDNALEFARLALVKANVYAINAQVNSGNFDIAEGFFREAVDQINEPCPQGGRVEVSKQDVNRNRQIDSGDTFVVSFANCQNTNGAIQTDFVSYTGSAESGLLSTRHYVTAQNFKATQPATGEVGEAQGTEGRRVELTSGRYQYIVHAPKTRIMESESGKGSASYTALTYLDIQGSLSSPQAVQVRMNYREKGDVSTRIDVPQSGAYTVQTEDAIVALRDNAVAQGTLLVQSGGRLVVRALGNVSGRYQVRVGLDANSDGVTERSCDFDYVQVMDGVARFDDQGCNSGGSPDLATTLLGGLPLVGPSLGSLLPGLLGR